MKPTISAYELMAIIGDKEVELILLRTQIARLQAELDDVKSDKKEQDA